MAGSEGRGRRAQAPAKQAQQPGRSVCLFLQGYCCLYLKKEVTPSPCCADVEATYCSPPERPADCWLIYLFYLCTGCLLGLSLEANRKSFSLIPSAQYVCSLWHNNIRLRKKGKPSTDLFPTPSHPQHQPRSPGEKKKKKKIP